MDKNISRSEKKRRFKQIADVAREISDLGEQLIEKLPGSNELADEIRLAKKLNGGARKRQVKYIAKLLQEEPLDEIIVFLKSVSGSKLRENKANHQAEFLRDRIIDDALEAYNQCCESQQSWELNWQSEAIVQVLDRYPDVDERELRRSAHQYARNHNKNHYREIFRIIKAAIDKEQYSPESQD